MIVAYETTLRLPNGTVVRARVLRDPRNDPGSPEADEHERALAWTRSITIEHHARYGMAQGCRHTSGFWRPRG